MPKVPPLFLGELERIQPAQIRWAWQRDVAEALKKHLTSDNPEAAGRTMAQEMSTGNTLPHPKPSQYQASHHSGSHSRKSSPRIHRHCTRTKLGPLGPVSAAGTSAIGPVTADLRTPRAVGNRVPRAASPRIRGSTCTLLTPRAALMMPHPLPPTRVTSADTTIGQWHVRAPSPRLDARPPRGRPSSRHNSPYPPMRPHEGAQGGGRGGGAAEVRVQNPTGVGLTTAVETMARGRRGVPAMRRPRAR